VNGVAHIHLKNSKRPAIVDVDMLDVLAGWRFFVNWVDRKRGIGWVRGYKNGKSAYIHRLLMDVPEGFVVDHVDGDTLNNRLENLRVVTPQENAQNKRYTRHHFKSGLVHDGDGRLRVIAVKFGVKLERSFLDYQMALAARKEVTKAQSVDAVLVVAKQGGWFVECPNCGVESGVTRCRKCGKLCCEACVVFGVCDTCEQEDY
jgi:hypothetical protein